MGAVGAVTMGATTAGAGGVAGAGAATRGGAAVEAVARAVVSGTGTVILAFFLPLLVALAFAAIVGFVGWGWAQGGFAAAVTFSGTSVSGALRFCPRVLGAGGGVVEGESDVVVVGFDRVRRGLLVVL